MHRVSSCLSSHHRGSRWNVLQPNHAHNPAAVVADRVSRVDALQAVSPLLRYTSLLPPAPHPLATSHGEAAAPLPSNVTKITSQVQYVPQTGVCLSGWFTGPNRMWSAACRIVCPMSGGGGFFSLLSSPHLSQVSRLFLSSRPVAVCDGAIAFVSHHLGLRAVHGGPVFVCRLRCPRAVSCCSSTLNHSLSCVPPHERC